jgi:oligoendopeptidase F
MEIPRTPATGAEEIRWDLTDLYAAGDDPAIDRDLDAADSRAAALRDQYYGRVAGLDSAGLAGMLAEYEAIGELAGKVGSFAFLHWSTDTEDASRGALLQRITERDSRLSQELVFVDLELANIPDESADELLSEPALHRYRHYIERARRYRPHLLSEPEEKILAEKSVTGRAAWTRLFEELHNAQRYALAGHSMSRDQVLNKLHDADRGVRRDAAAALTAGLQEMIRPSTYIFNTILADKASDDRLRHYPTWISARNLGNEVDDRVVQALVDAVTSRYDIVGRYYRLKRRLLGLDELFDYDRYAPLPAADRIYGWSDARAMVLAAYGRFHPRMAQIAQQFFERRWIDAATHPGKHGGAYSHSTVPSVHPYVLLNYEGRPRDVMTLAHELGHGVHQTLARPQGLLQANTPLTTAETASVFGEMLMFQDLMTREGDPAVRLAMLTSKIEDTFATIFRQVSMNRFEDAIHTARRERGELTADRLAELWLGTQRAMFGDSVNMTDNYGLWWSYVHHFVNTPGYVYAYAFGNLLVLALYARYTEVGPAFADRYLEMLAAGGSDYPHEIVRPLGVDLNDLGFWSHGLDILDHMVRDAEELAAA